MDPRNGTTNSTKTSPSSISAPRAGAIASIAVAGGATLAGVVVIMLGWVVMLHASVRLSPDPVEEARLAKIAQRQALEAQYAFLGPAGSTLDSVSFARGRQLYALACVTCHGPEGRGVPKLGKDLVYSRFSRELSDAELAAFIIRGRDLSDPLNTTKVPMPPRGGRNDYSDKDIADVVAYVRGLADPRRIPEGPLPDVVVAQAMPEPEPEPLASSTANGAGALAQLVSLEVAPDPEAVKRGKRVFASCMTCHGRDGTGIKNMGKDLVHSKFIADRSDADLLAFIKKGRGPSDPDNTTKIAMPPKGGNPALNDKQLLDVIAYVRSLQLAAGK